MWTWILDKAWSLFVGWWLKKKPELTPEQRQAQADREFHENIRLLAREFLRAMDVLKDEKQLRNPQFTVVAVAALLDIREEVAHNVVDYLLKHDRIRPGDHDQQYRLSR